MVKQEPLPGLGMRAIAVLLLASGLWLTGCSGPQGGASVEPDYRFVNIVFHPPLQTKLNEPNTRLMTVNQIVRVEAWSLGTNVNAMVTWGVSPRNWQYNPTGTMTDEGQYLAPSSPSQVTLGIEKSHVPANPNVVYLGSCHVDILAAPFITSFVADPVSIQIGQSTHLTAIFSDGQGQILVAGEVLVSSLVSGSPVTVAPSATTTYTLRVTNPAGAFVDQELTVTVQ